MAVFVDIEQAARTLINHAPGLVGEGMPLAKGAHLARPHGDWMSWAEVQVTGGFPALAAEGPVHAGSVSWLVFGRTREAAARAAVAVANYLASLDGAPVSVGMDTVLLADNVSGPVWAPDGAGPRYLVTADLYCRAPL